MTKAKKVSSGQSGEKTDKTAADLAATGQLTELESRLAALEEALKLERADFVNFKRRTDEERVSLLKMAKADVATAFLPVYDSLERALEMVADTSGLELVRKSFLDVLAGYEIRPLDLSGGFNPEYCEGVGFVPGDKAQDGQIAQVIEAGFKLGDLVVRPAKVTIYKVN